MEHKRARRRRDLERMKARAIRVYWFSKPSQAAKLANYIKNCSCHMCGNPRRYEKSEERLTMQERKAFQCVED